MPPMPKSQLDGPDLKNEHFDINSKRIPLRLIIAIAVAVLLIAGIFLANLISNKSQPQNKQKPFETTQSV